MNERDEFLGWVGTRLGDAATALHNGDAESAGNYWTFVGRRHLGTAMDHQVHATLGHRYVSSASRRRTRQRRTA
jgi:hypothetical protein